MTVMFDEPLLRAGRDQRVQQAERRQRDCQHYCRCKREKEVLSDRTHRRATGEWTRAIGEQ